MSLRVGVVGGGLAGIRASLDLAAKGHSVTLFERKNKLGGLTWSFERNGRSFDNGQHVFLRCCTTYIEFLRDISASGTVTLQKRLDVPVLSPGKKAAHIRRNALPAPAHLGLSLLTFSRVSIMDRLRLGPAVIGLMRLTLDDPKLDEISFGEWLKKHGQSKRAIERLFDLITIATVNVCADEASLALAARVFRTGLLDANDGGDLGWSKVPLTVLHHERPLAALKRQGVSVKLTTTVTSLSQNEKGWTVSTKEGIEEFDALVVALSPHGTKDLVGDDVVGDLDALGVSPIVNVHLIFDRRVMDLPFAAGVDSPVQFVFDHTGASGMNDGEGQALSISLSAAGDYIGQRPEVLIATFCQEIAKLFPKAKEAQLLDAVVSREHRATFRGAPGQGAFRPDAATKKRGLFLAGTFCNTGWPATMESALRSGRSAASAVCAFEGAEQLVGVKETVAS